VSHLEPPGIERFRVTDRFRELPADSDHRPTRGETLKMNDPIQPRPDPLRVRQGPESAQGNNLPTGATDYGGRTGQPGRIPASLTPIPTNQPTRRLPATRQENLRRLPRIADSQAPEGQLLSPVTETALSRRRDLARGHSGGWDTGRFVSEHEAVHRTAGDDEPLSQPNVPKLPGTRIKMDFHPN